MALNDFFLGKKDYSALATEGLSIVAYQYDNTCFELGFFAETGLTPGNNTASSAKVRQAEFFAGRYAAREAFAQFGVDASAIGVGQHRQPLWPEAYCASISHTKTVAVCVAAPNTHVDYLGVDIENIIASKTAENVKSSIINADEEATLLACGFTLEQGLTLAFSAKESIFKAAYPYVGRYFDFSAARVDSISPTHGQLRMIIAEDLATKVPKGLMFNLTYLWEEDKITTLLAGRF